MQRYFLKSKDKTTITAVDKKVIKKNKPKDNANKKNKKTKITIMAIDKNKDSNYYQQKKDKFLEEHNGKTLNEAIAKFNENFNILQYDLKSIYNDKLNLKDKEIDYFDFVPYTYNSNKKYDNFKVCINIIHNFFCNNISKKSKIPFMVKRFLLNYNDSIHMMPLIIAKKNNKNYIIMDNNDVYRWDHYFLEFLLKDESMKNVNFNIIALPPIQNDNKTCYVSAYETIKHLNNDNIENIISQCENGCALLESEKIIENNNLIKKELDENKKIEKIYNIPYSLVPSKLLQYAQTRKVFQDDKLLQQDNLKEKMTPFVEQVHTSSRNMKLGYRFMRFFDKYKQKQKEQRKQENIILSRNKQKNNERIATNEDKNKPINRYCLNTESFKKKIKNPKNKKTINNIKWQLDCRNNQK